MATNTARIQLLTERLALVRAAIAGTLERNAQSYSAEIQSLTSLKLPELEAMEQRIINDLARLRRGTRFGSIGFRRVIG